MSARGGRDRGHLVVVGGGLAGIAAALLAADAGAEVTLLEARPRLGGATTSFRRGDLWVDTGQHVFMRCCTAYRGLLQRLDVEHLTTLQPRLDVPVLLGDTGALTRLRRTRVPLPPPLHLAPALLGYKALPLAERLRAGLAAFQLGRLDQRAPAVDGQSFGGWLASHGQGPAATENLWELLTVATLNAPAAEASLGLAAKVVRTGLLEGAAAGDLGWADVPLSRLHGDAGMSALAAAGARVHTGVKVRSITPPPAGGRWEVAVATGGSSQGGTGPDGTGAALPESGVLRADAVVLAVPPPAAAALLPAGALPAPERLPELGSSPIINIHMIYPRQVIEGPFLAVVDSPIQWIFDRTESSGLAATGPAGAQYLALSQSAAAPWIDRPANELRDLFVAEMARLFPAARAVDPLEVFVTRERTATFRQAPGSLALRPAAPTGLPGFALAGAWTDTGWPATMEGAVRSGLAAARETLAGMGVDVSELVMHGTRVGPDGSDRPEPVTVPGPTTGTDDRDHRAVTRPRSGVSSSAIQSRTWDASQSGQAGPPDRATTAPSEGMPSSSQPLTSPFADQTGTRPSTSAGVTVTGGTAPDDVRPDPQGEKAVPAGSAAAVPPAPPGPSGHTSTGGFPA